MEIKNQKLLLIYILSLVVSVVLIVPFCINKECIIFIVLESIGCSGVAASLLAIFIYAFESKKKQNEVQHYKEFYIKPLYDDFVILIEKLLWVSEFIDSPAVNWTLPLESYTKVEFQLYVDHNFKSKNVYSFDDVKLKLNEFGNKYNQSNYLLLNAVEKTKIKKVFSIILVNMRHLISSINTLVEQRLFLDYLNIISLENIDTISRQINLVCYIFEKENTNYESAIKLLLASFDMISHIYSIEKLFRPNFVTYFD